MQHVINNFIFGNIWDFGDPFTIVIDTRNTISGGSAENEWKFPQNTDVLDGYINFLIDWGDGEFSRITSKAQALVPHVYSVPGIYTINMYKYKNSNSIISPRYENHPYERNKILKIINFGPYSVSRNAFQDCPNLDLSELNTTSITSSATFERWLGRYKFSSLGSLKTINCNNSSFSSIFFQCYYLDVPDLTINTIAVNMDNSFYECVSLSAIKKVNGANLRNFNSAFRSCHAFVGDIVDIFNVNWSQVTNLTNFMTKTTTHSKYVPYPPELYDKFLNVLDAGGATNVPMTFSSKYTSAGATARANLITKGWTITDGGLI